MLVFWRICGWQLICSAVFLFMLVRVRVSVRNALVVCGCCGCVVVLVRCVGARLIACMVVYVFCFMMCVWCVCVYLCGV